MGDYEYLMNDVPAGESMVERTFTIGFALFKLNDEEINWYEVQDPS